MFSEAAHARRKRSKKGCYTCRKRKVRCDEQHPACRACIRLNLSCSFPGAADRVLAPAAGRQRRQHALPDTTAQPRLREALAFPAQTLSPPPHPSPSSLGGGGGGGSLDGSLSGSPGECRGSSRSSSGRIAASYPNGFSASQYEQPPSSWWSSLGDGLLNVNWLECWTPELGDQILNHPACGIGQQPIDEDPRQPVPDKVAPPARATSPGRNRNVTLRPEDRQILHHFTTTMVRFCILRNCVHDNLYSYILLNLGMFHSSLFDAMMAWSALHLAHVQKKSNQDARRRYDRAYTALIEDLGHGVAPSLLLATAWFLLQYQLILAESVESFCELIDLSAEVARNELQNHSAETAMRRIGPVGSLILVWMSFRDCQAAQLGLGGRLIGCLKTYPYIYDLVDASSVSNEGSGNNSPDIVFMEREQISQRDKPSEMQTCMKLSFQNVFVSGQIRFLARSDVTTSSVNDGTAWEAVRANLGLLRGNIELDETEAARAALGVATGDLAAMPLVEPIHYNRLLLLSSYYTTVIQYHSCRPGDSASSDPELLLPEECADRMIRLCQRVETARPNSPQGIWPMQVLIAGTTTRDPIYQAWAIRTFEKAERWGGNIVKARVLLDAVVRKQNATGKKADIVEVMKDTTGIFIF